MSNTDTHTRHRNRRWHSERHRSRHKSQTQWVTQSYRQTHVTDTETDTSHRHKSHLHVQLTFHFWLEILSEISPASIFPRWHWKQDTGNGIKSQATLTQAVSWHNWWKGWRGVGLGLGVFETKTTNPKQTEKVRICCGVFVVFTTLSFTYITYLLCSSFSLLPTAYTQIITEAVKYSLCYE